MSDKDTIYRQAAIDAVLDRMDIEKHGRNAKPEEIMWALEKLPSAQPKHGYWIESHEHIYVGNGVKEWTNWYCSECDAPNDKPTDFCPNCGVRMERETNI